MRSVSRHCTWSWLRDADAAASILATDGRRIVRALEVIELTGSLRCSAPTIGAPRWDTAIVGLDWDTAILDERLARRTELMFADGLVDEVRCSLAGGLRDGVTAGRALGPCTGDRCVGCWRNCRRPGLGTRADLHRHPPLCAPAALWFRRDHRIRWLDGSADDLVAAVVARWRQVS